MMLIRKIPLLAQLLAIPLVVAAIGEWFQFREFFQSHGSFLGNRLLWAESALDPEIDHLVFVPIFLGAMVLAGLAFLIAWISMQRHPVGNGDLMNRLLEAGWQSDRAYPDTYPFQPLPPSWHDVVTVIAFAAYSATIVPHWGTAVLVGYSLGIAHSAVLVSRPRERLGMAFVAVAMIIALTDLANGYWIAAGLAAVLFATVRNAMHNLNAVVGRLESNVYSLDRQRVAPFEDCRELPHAGFPHRSLADVRIGNVRPFFRIAIACGWAVLLYMGGRVGEVSEQVRFADSAVAEHDRLLMHMMFVTGPVFIAGAVRTARRVVLLVPHVGVWSRVRTGRLIIPAYDKCLLPVVVAMVLSVVWIFFCSSTVQPLAISVGGGCLLAAVLLVPCNVEAFALTGFGRVANLGQSPQQEARADQTAAKNLGRTRLSRPFSISSAVADLFRGARRSANDSSSPS